MINEVMKDPAPVLAGDFLLMALTLSFLIFTLIYGFFFRWYDNEVGRTMFPAFVLMSLVLMQTSASALSDSDYPGRNPIRIALYGSGFVMMVALIALVVWLYWRKRNISRKLKAGKTLTPKECAYVKSLDQPSRL